MFVLTPEQKANFDENGFLIVDKLIDDETVARLRERYDRLFRGEFETGISPDEVNWQEGKSDPSLSRQICNGWRADRAVAATVLREDLGRAIAELGDWPGTRIMQDNVIWKPPGTRALLYHRDNAYLSWFRPTEMLSCWIALDETRSDAGTIEFVRGSHRWKPTGPEGEFHGPENYREFMEKSAAAEGVEPEIVHVEVPPGGGSFHHGWTWHGSGSNAASVPRRSLVLHGIRSDTHYVPERLNEGNGPVYGRYKRFGDDTMDENYFPILWTRNGHRTESIDSYIAAAQP